MDLTLNIPADDALDALLNIKPEAIELLTVSLRDGDEIELDRIDEIEKVVNTQTRAFGLSFTGHGADSLVDTTLTMAIADIDSVEVELKSSHLYDLSDQVCTCTCEDDEDTSEDERPGVADIIAGLKAHVPDSLKDALAERLRSGLDEHVTTYAPEQMDAMLADAPAGAREAIEELLSSLPEGVELGDVKVIKLPNPFVTSEQDDEASDEAQADRQASETPEQDDDEVSAEARIADITEALNERIETVGATLAKVISGYAALKESAAESEQNDTNEDGDEADQGDESNEDNIATEEEHDLTADAAKLNEAFGDGARADVENEDDAHVEDKETKKLIHIKRGEDDRFYTGPNFTSKKNRLGEGRLKKTAEKLLEASEGQKVQVTYRNTPMGVVSGEGKLVFDMRDRGTDQVAKVGVHTNRFGASILNQDDEFDSNLTELILFEA